MPAILYGLAAYRRDNGNLPEFKLENMFVERTPSAEAGVTLLSRPGLLASTTCGAGPVQGVFSQKGTLGGALFVVSGGGLYKDGALLGAIDGTGPASFAASASEVVVTLGASAWSYNGTDLAAIAFPDSASVTAVAFIAGLFVFVRAGSHKFYWSAVLNARSIDALDFASAESSPDELLDVKVIGDTILFCGQGTIEAWMPTGGLNLPFSRIQQRIYRKGVIATGCAQEHDNALAWVGSDGMVYRSGEVPERLSDHGIEERIEQSTTVSTFSFVYEGHNFFCIRLDSGTFARDAATQQWSEFKSYGRSKFRAQCATTEGRVVTLGDDETGTLWTLSGHKDGADPVVRLFTAAFPLKGGGVTVDNLNVEANTGRTQLLTGQGSDPVLEMRSSRDAGGQWTEWRPAALGQQGQYRTLTRYRRLGMFDAPGAMFEFRCSDPVPLRVSGVTANEPGGGRSR